MKSNISVLLSFGFIVLIFYAGSMGEYPHRSGKNCGRVMIDHVYEGKRELVGIWAGWEFCQNAFIPAEYTPNVLGEDFRFAVLSNGEVYFNDKLLHRASVNVG